MPNELSRRLFLLSPLLVMATNTHARGGRGGRGRGYWGGRGGSISGKGAMWLVGICGVIFTIIKVNSRIEARKEAKRRASEIARLEEIERMKPPRDQWEALSLCLLCGSPMIAKTAKTGRNRGKQFLGCVSYPRCLGTRKVDKHTPPARKPTR